MRVKLILCLTLNQLFLCAGRAKYKSRETRDASGATRLAAWCGARFSVPCRLQPAFSRTSTRMSTLHAKACATARGSSETRPHSDGQQDCLAAAPIKMDRYDLRKPI